MAEQQNNNRYRKVRAFLLARGNIEPTAIYPLRELIAIARMVNAVGNALPRDVKVAVGEVFVMRDDQRAAQNDPGVHAARPGMDPPPQDELPRPRGVNPPNPNNNNNNNRRANDNRPPQPNWQMGGAIPPARETVPPDARWEGRRRRGKNRTRGHAPGGFPNHFPPEREQDPSFVNPGGKRVHPDVAGFAFKSTNREGIGVNSKPTRVFVAHPDGKIYTEGGVRYARYSDIVHEIDKPEPTVVKRLFEAHDCTVKWVVWFSVWTFFFLQPYSGVQWIEHLVFKVLGVMTYFFLVPLVTVGLGSLGILLFTHILNNNSLPQMFHPHGNFWQPGGSQHMGSNTASENNILIHRAVPLHMLASVPMGSFLAEIFFPNTFVLQRSLAAALGITHYRDVLVYDDVYAKLERTHGGVKPNNHTVFQYEQEMCAAFPDRDCCVIQDTIRVFLNQRSIVAVKHRFSQLNMPKHLKSE